MVAPLPTAAPQTRAPPAPITDAAPPDAAPNDAARLRPEAVSVIAQSISHLLPLTDAAAAALAADVEYRLRQIVQDGLKFMRHSKRQRLLTNDVNSALRLRNTDPVYGFQAPPAKTYHYQQQIAQQRHQPAIRNGRPRSTSSHSLPGSSHSHPPQRGQHPGSSPNSQYADKSAGANDAARPTTPGAATSSAPVDAEARNAPSTQNPNQDESHQAATHVTPKPLSPANAVCVDHKQEPPFAQVNGIPQLYFARDRELNIKQQLNTPLPPVPLEVTIAAHWLAVDSCQPTVAENPVPNGLDDAFDAKKLTKRNKRKRGDAFYRGNAAVASADTGAPPGKQRRGGASTVPTEVKPPVKHVLSRELQLYFEHVTSCVLQSDLPQLATCLPSVADEPGLVQLLPYLTLFVCDTVKQQVHNLRVLVSVMRLVSAVMDNGVFQLDNYMHQLLPAVLTCLVGKRLCAKPRQNHWALRDYTASLVRRICERFGRQYTNMQTRTTYTLVKALDELHRPLTTHYGAILGIAVLGPIVTHDMLLPRVAKYAPNVEAVLNDKTQKPVRRFEAAKVYGALAWAVWHALASAAAKMSHQANGDSSKLDSLNSPDAILVDNEICPKRVSTHLPQAEKLLPLLKEEFGSRLFPFDQKQTGEELGEAINRDLADDNNVK